MRESALLEPVFLEAVGIVAPGLPDWPTAAAVLAGRAAYAADTPFQLTGALLPANERRRSTRLTRLALQPVAQIEADLARQAGDVASVFASAEGDTAVIDAICTALAQPDRPVSPTQFHHSVHNAPAGYFALGTGTRAPSTSISADTGTFAAGLLEAATLAQVQERSVLLVAYDDTLPPALAGLREIEQACGCALLLTPARTPVSLAALRLAPMAPAATAETILADPALERLRRANPAARVLALLRPVARAEPGDVSLPYGSAGRLVAMIAPCA